MAMCNIPSTITDPSYRYNMPKIISQKEGSGNGKKTRIVNMGDVARAIKRPPQYTTKWFGSEFGADSSYTNKQGEGERAIVNGHCDTHVLQTCLDKFLEKYVLCPNCHLPEIDLIVRKNISAKCMACGWAGDLDNKHKLKKFVVRNPPDDSGLNLRDSAAEVSGGRLDRKARREEKQRLAAMKKEADGTDKEDGDNEDDDDGESFTDKEKNEKKEKNDKKEKKDKSGDKNDKKYRKEKKAKATKEDFDNDGDEDNEVKKKERKEKNQKNDNKDKADKKQKNDKEEKTDKKTKKYYSDGGNAVDDDTSDTAGKGQVSKNKGGELEYDDDEVKPVISLLAALSVSKGTSLKAADYLEELTNHRLAKNFDQKTSLYITMEALCGNRMNAKALEDKAKYFDKLIESLKLTGTDVLWAFGAYLDMNPGAKKLVAQQLKVAYEQNWAEEKTILEFYNDEEGEGTPAFADAQQAAGPCLKWLAEAEEDDDDDGDDHDESDD